MADGELESIEQDLTTVIVIGDDIFIPRIIEEFASPHLNHSWNYRQEEECPRCGSISTCYVANEGWYCLDCRLLWEWCLVV